jgi:translation elongation factor EF-1beta
VAFDVMVNDEDEDLNQLFEDIVGKIKKDGLVWNKNYQLRDITRGK